jgi:hypothetical protein
MTDNKKKLFEIIDKLREQADLIRTDPRKAYPRWVFELESLSRELMNLFKYLSKARGGSGKLQEEVSQLNNLRHAILKLSSLTATGGWSISYGIIHQTIQSVIDDLEVQLELLTGAAAVQNDLIPGDQFR